MKLYVTQGQQKIYLDIVADTRQSLANSIGSYWFTLHGGTYHVSQVMAESSSNSTAAGAVVGGLVGILGGPIGLLVGGIFGGALGSQGDKTESERVGRFNRSQSLG
jgi:hypothetical protein